MRRFLWILLATAACGGGDGGGGDGGADGAGPDAAQVPCEGCTIVTLPTAGCGPITGAGDGTVRWADEACAPRGTQLAGSVARWFELEVGGATRRATGGPEWDGMGYVTSHAHEGPAFVEDCAGGAVTDVLAGPNHRIRRVECSFSATPYAASGTIRLVVDWFFATGRSHPVYAITYDLTGVPADDLWCDARAPYGEVGFDGDAGGTVDRVAWGDSYRFESLGTLDKLNGWDYSQPNVVPFAMERIGANDAQMGLVQTEPQARHAAGGYWFYGSWGTSDPDGPMPDDYNWAYQLNQYSFNPGETTASTRLAWGMNFGAVGHTAYAVLGEDPDAPPPGSPSGWPYQSYATYVVIGTDTGDVVDQAVGRVEVDTTAVTVDATTGAPATSLPGGVGRTDAVPLAQPGYDPRYGVYRLDAAAGAVTATFHVAGTTPLFAPIVVVHGAAADATISLAGVPQTEGDGVLTSYDAAAGDLWISFRSTWLGDVPLDVR